MMKRLPLLVKLAPVYLLIGFMLFSIVFAQRHHDSQVKAAGVQASHIIASSAPAPQVVIQGSPVRILIPSVGIDVKIVNGYYDTASHNWSVAYSYANYATVTSLPNNQTGTPLIYGHWFKQVFGNTKNLQVGDVAYVYTDNGHVLSYTYSGANLVNPTDTQIFNQPTSGHGLNLLTCDGAWAQYRRIMNFNFQKAV